MGIDSARETIFCLYKSHSYETIKLILAVFTKLPKNIQNWKMNSKINLERCVITDRHKVVPEIVPNMIQSILALFQKVPLVPSLSTNSVCWCKL